MSQSADMLERYGWTRVSTQRRGMYTIIKWHDPKTFQIYPQSFAVIVQRDRNKQRRLSQAQKGAE